jgi:tetratricopeptide (TPR) repeat protein
VVPVKRSGIVDGCGEWKWRRRWQICVAVPALALICLPLGAQQQGAVSPEVQQLYAEARAAQARGDTSEAIEKYQAMVKADPGLAPAWNNLGLLYCNQHDYAHAIAALDAGLRLDPHMTTAYALLGTCLYATGKYAEARTALESALRGNPHDDQVEMLLARTLMHLGDDPAAAVHLRALTERDPQNQEAWYQLGKLYLRLSQDSFARVDAIDPNSALAHMIQGEIMDGMKNYQGALVEFGKAVEIDPHRAGLQEDLGNVNWELGNWDSARRAFLAAVASDPADCMARWKAANCLVEQHASPDIALGELNEAVEQCGDLMQARVDRARALIQLGRPAEALDDLLAAEKATPDEPSIHFLLAGVYRAQHQTADAEKELKIYAELEQSASAKVAQQAAAAEAAKSAQQH